VEKTGWDSRRSTSGERARSRASAGPAAAGLALVSHHQPLRQPERSPAATNAVGGQNCVCGRARGGPGGEAGRGDGARRAGGTERGGPGDRARRARGTEGCGPGGRSEADRAVRRVGGMGRDTQIDRAF
jgi:hypothetical protein